MKKLITFIINIIKNNELARFVIVGGLNNLSYIVFFTIAFKIGRRELLVSNTVAFLLSLVGSFYMNSYFTYKVKPTIKKFLAFPSVYVVSYLINTVCLYVCVNILGISAYIALFIALLFNVPATFIFSRFIMKRGEKKEIIQK